MEPLREIDDTFCIAVLGDFLGTPSGAPGGGEASWTVRRATPDTVLKLLGLRPTLRVPNPGDGRLQEIPLSNLDGFQPEDLFRRLDLFGPLRQAREEAR